MNEKSSSTKRLFMAVEEGEIDIVEKLLSDGAHIDTVDEETGHTLLIRSVIKGQTLIADQLIGLGADPEKEDADGKTAKDHLRDHLAGISEEDKQRDAYVKVGYSLLRAGIRKNHPNLVH